MEEDVEASYSENADIQFIRYTGYDSRCNICSGTLVLRINGKNVTFGREGMFAEFFYPEECWSNTGCTNYRNTAKGWNIDVKELPMEYRPYAKQIHDLINRHMPKEFCIGCY